MNLDFTKELKKFPDYIVLLFEQFGHEGENTYEDFFGCAWVQMFFFYNYISRQRLCHQYFIPISWKSFYSKTFYSNTAYIWKE